MQGTHSDCDRYGDSWVQHIGIQVTDNPDSDTIVTASAGDQVTESLVPDILGTASALVQVTSLQIVWLWTK